MTFIDTLIAYKWVIIFYAAVMLLVFSQRKKFDIQGIIALYRTKIGLGLMDSISKKHKKIIKFFGYVSIVLGGIGFIGICYAIGKSAFDIIIQKEGAVGASLVLPGIPIAGTPLVFPLITGWITLFIIIVVHEFAHGVVARAHNIKVLHSGIAFFGPILGAFVEPDEKGLVKKSDIQQHAVFSAGPAANILLAAVAALVFFFVLPPAMDAITLQQGVVINVIPGNASAQAGMADGAVITSINNNPISNWYDLDKTMEGTGPNQTIVVVADGKEFYPITKAHPDDSQRGYLGILLVQNKVVSKPGFDMFLPVVRWLGSLFFWLAFISINIGLINLFPIFITDGARMLKVFLERLIKDKKMAFSVWKHVNIVAVFLILILLLLPLFKLITAI